MKTDGDNSKKVLAEEFIFDPVHRDNRGKLTRCRSLKQRTASKISHAMWVGVNNCWRKIPPNIHEDQCSSMSTPTTTSTITTPTRSSSAIKRSRLDHLVTECDYMKYQMADSIIMDVEFTFDPFAEMIVTRDLIKNQDASLNGQ